MTFVVVSDWAESSGTASGTDSEQTESSRMPFVAASEQSKSSRVDAAILGGAVVDAAALGGELEVYVVQTH